MSPTPRLLSSWEARAPRGVVLLLHGGSDQSHLPASRAGVAALRMLPIASAVARAGRGHVTVARLINAVRGWNGEERSPVVDARWALEQLRRRHPGVPVAVLGHSMGGRAALHVADDPAVRIVVGLAPWVTSAEPARLLEGRQVVLVHGSQDRTTSPEASAELVRLAQGVARSATLVRVAGQGHTLLGRADAAGRLCAQVAVAGLLGPALGGPRPGSLLADVLDPEILTVDVGADGRRWLARWRWAPGP